MNRPSADLAVQPGRGGLRVLLANREFRLLWLIGAASNTLRWLEILAVGVVVFDMTESPFQVAFMVILRSVQPEERSLAVGLSYLVLRLVGSIPGPILF